MTGRPAPRRRLVRVVTLAAVFTFLVLAYLGFRPGRTPPLRDAGGKAIPGSVARLEEVELGGSPQWILIRGADRANPVLLFLHGGPGMPAMYLAHDFQRQMERDFTIVHWDRRGAGKSFSAGADPSTLTVRRTRDEAIELTEWLRREFGQERIYLLGHSWGSYLGMLAVEHRPDLFAAFVGTGQMAADVERVRRVQRAGLVPLAETAGDQSTVARLEGGGTPTETDLFRYGAELRGAKSMWPIIRTGLRASEYTLWDVFNVGRGASRLSSLMKHDVIAGPLDREILSVDVPVFFLLGRHDLNTPSSLAARYLDDLEAPLKKLVWMEESAHFPFWTEADAFHEELRRVHQEAESYWSTAAGPG